MNNCRFDPIEAFVDGFTTTIGRVFIGLGLHFAPLLILFMIFQIYTLDTEAGFSFIMIFLLVPSIFITAFAWMTQGAWVLFGMAAILTVISSLWYFVVRDGSKRCVYILFTSSYAYYSLLVFESCLVTALAVFISLSGIYWGIPYLINKKSN